MSALALYNAAAITPAQDLQFGLIDRFIEFIDRGEKTTRTYIGNLKQFAAWLKFAEISRPVRQDVISYRQYLTEEHAAIQLDAASIRGWSYRTDAAGRQLIIKCKPNTVKQYLQSVRQFFKWTAAEGYYPNIADNIHAPNVKQDLHRKEALSAADVLTIENSIKANAAQRTAAAAANKKDTAGRVDRATEQSKRLYAMYLLAVNCGLRTIEISRANIKDLETKGGITYLYIWGKGHTEADQKKPLAPEVKAALDDYLASRTDAKSGSSPLFVSTGNRSGGARIASTTISTMLKRAMQQAGFDSERITAHSLRHTAGTNVQELTGNIYLTQQYMRHANPATTEIYLHNDTEKQEAGIAQRLYNYYHGSSTTDDARQQLESIIATLGPEQLTQLTGIATAIAH